MPEESHQEEIGIDYQQRLQEALGKIDSKKIAQVSEEQKRNWAMKLASEFHENWRNTRKTPAGYEPRPKPTRDISWVNKAREHQIPEQKQDQVTGKHTVDIANLEFGNLPEDWQEENLKAAEFVLDHVVEAIKEGQTNELLDTSGSAVNSAWIQRHKHEPWVQQDPVLAQGWSHPTFSTDQKNKDREQVVLAAELIANLLS